MAKVPSWMAGPNPSAGAGVVPAAADDLPVDAAHDDGRRRPLQPRVEIERRVERLGFGKDDHVRQVRRRFDIGVGEAVVDGLHHRCPGQQRVCRRGASTRPCPDGVDVGGERARIPVAIREPRRVQERLGHDGSALRAYIVTVEDCIGHHTFHLPVIGE
jgi:hypothetical protein